MRIDRTRKIVVALALAAITVLAFTGVSRNDFVVLDDREYLIDNPMVRGGLSLRGIAWAFTTTQAANWHPLTWLSHMLDVTLFGLNPGAHHLVGLALHVANALLLLLALSRLTGALWPSALVAALFALHPLHVESVAWAAERKDLLSTLFALAALLAYERAARRGAVARSVAVPALFALALLAKPMPVTLPFLLLLLDFWPLGRTGPRPSPTARAPGAWMIPPARLWLEKLPLFLLAAASAAVTLFAQSRGGAVVSQTVLPLQARAANALLSYAAYIAKAIWPVDLSIYYPHPVRLPPWHLLAGAAAVLGAGSLLAIRGARRRPWLPVGWLWYLGSLVPVIGLVQVGSQGRADRYTYLPLTGLFVAAAWLLAEIADRRSRLRVLVAAGCAAALFALAGLSARQVALWRNSRTLFSHALSLPGENAMAHDSIGVWLYAEGRFEEALAQFREGVRLAPWSAELVFHRGTALEALGNLPAAEASYRRAVELDRNHARAWNNLGIVLGKLGRSAEAEIAYQWAIGVDPRLPQAHFNLGVILASRGNVEEAAARYRTALEIDPESAQAHTNLGVLLAAEKRYAEAAAHFRAAAAREPQNAAARRNLGNVLMALGEREAGERELLAARELEARGEAEPARATPPLEGAP